MGLKAKICFLVQPRRTRLDYGKYFNPGVNAWARENTRPEIGSIEWRLGRDSIYYHSVRQATGTHIKSKRRVLMYRLTTNHAFNAFFSITLLCLAILGVSCSKTAQPSNNSTASAPSTASSSSGDF